MGRKEIEINIDGMECETCAKNVRAAIDSVNGIMGAEIIVSDHIAKVVFDDSITDINEIFSAIEEKGYEPS